MSERARVLIRTSLPCTMPHSAVYIARNSCEQYGNSIIHTYIKTVSYWVIELLHLFCCALHQYLCCCCFHWGECVSIVTISTASAAAVAVSQKSTQHHMRQCTYDYPKKRTRTANKHTKIIPTIIIVIIMTKLYIVMTCLFKNISVLMEKRWRERERAKIREMGDWRDHC